MKGSQKGGHTYPRCEYCIPPEAVVCGIVGGGAVSRAAEVDVHSNGPAAASAAICH